MPHPRARLCSTLILTFTLSLTLTHLCSIIEGATVRSTVFCKTDGSRVAPSEEFPLCAHGRCTGTQLWCVLLCSTHEQCRSVNYHQSDGQCMGVSSTLYTLGISSNTESGWENFSPHIDTVRDGDWILVFRSQRTLGTNPSTEALAAWNNASLRTDDNLLTLHPDCYAKTAASCVDHFRSKLIENWPSSSIDQVRVALYEGGVQAAEMVFNGQGSTQDSWFDTSQLLSSSWTDMTPSDANNHFLLTGQLQSSRIFMVTTEADENNCNQIGWMIVMNKMSNRCSFDYYTSVVNGNQPNVPQILYSPASTKINFRTDTYNQADVMAIFIKLK